MKNLTTNNVTQFKTQDTLTTIVTRNAEWRYDQCGIGAATDFKILAEHDHGSIPFDAVTLAVFIRGRQSNVFFAMDKTAVLAMSELFATVAKDMIDVKE